MSLSFGVGVGSCTHSMAGGGLFPLVPSVCIICTGIDRGWDSIHLDHISANISSVRVELTSDTTGGSFSSVDIIICMYSSFSKRKACYQL